MPTVLPPGVTRHRHRRISAGTLFSHIRAPVRNIQGHVEGKRSIRQSGIVWLSIVPCLAP